MDDFVVVDQHRDMIAYVDNLQKINSETLSFYPRQAFERAYDTRKLLLGILNGQPSGYLYVGGKGRNVVCYQVCIQYDARRKLYGAMLVAAMENYAIERQALSVRLRCGSDLEANLFWRELGYNCVNIEDGGIRRSRKINVWRKQLMPELFEDVHLDPSTEKTDSNIWRKHKHLGIVSRFNRRKSIKEYRMFLKGKEVR